jgi:metal-responsive CopG/Arc/MetJ family transcriptional regulator
MSTARKGVQRGKREQISHTLPHELLALLDESAKAKGLTRAGLINLAISEYLSGKK